MRRDAVELVGVGTPGGGTVSKPDERVARGRRTLTCADMARRSTSSATTNSRALPPGCARACEPVWRRHARSKIGSTASGDATRIGFVVVMANVRRSRIDQTGCGLANNASCPIPFASRAPILLVRRGRSPSLLRRAAPHATRDDAHLGCRTPTCSSRSPRALRRFPRAFPSRDAASGLDLRGLLGSPPARGRSRCSPPSGS